MSRRTSSRVTRGPSRRTAATSTSRSRAARRADGVAGAPFVAGAGASAAGGVTVGVEPGEGAAGAAGFEPGEAAAGAAPSSMVPSTSPIFTSAPSAWAMDFRTPAFGAATSTSTLSVSSSTSASPAATASPSCLSQRATRASTIDSPTSGTMMLTAMMLRYRRPAIAGRRAFVSNACPTSRA
ncbi:MAG: hypothetical protein R2752_08185 [Vicinamibacterales bacterium]